MLVKPTLYKISPFDVTKGTTILYSWSGRQVKSSTVVIQTNDTHEQVYEKTFTPTKLPNNYHDIDGLSGTTLFQNGKSYRAKIKITDMGNEESVYSDWVTFKCYSTPDFKLEIKNSDYNSVAQTIKSSNVNIQMSFVLNEAESENQLNTWKVFLYNQGSEDVEQSSSTLYASNIQYISFSGLMNNKDYRIKAIGTTVTGMYCETEEILFKTQYDVPVNFVNLEVKNDKHKGHLAINSYAVSVDGHTTKDAVYVYRDNDPYAVKLTDDVDDYVYFNENVLLDTDFTLFMRAFKIQAIDYYYDGIDFPIIDNIYEPQLERILTNNAFMALDGKINDKYIRIYFSLVRNQNDVEFKQYNLIGDLDDNGEDDNIVSEEKNLYFTKFVGQDVYRVFAYCNDKEYKFGLWSNAIEDYEDGDAIALAFQRKNGLFNLRVLKTTT